MRQRAGISPLAVGAANGDRERFRIDPHVPVAAGSDIGKPATHGFAEGGRYRAMSLFLGTFQEGPRRFESVFETLEAISLDPGRFKFFFGFSNARQSPFALANAA